MQGSRHLGVRSYSGMDIVYSGFLPCQGPLVCLCLFSSWNVLMLHGKLFVHAQERKTKEWSVV